MCVGVFLSLCLFTPSVSHALCPNGIDVSSPFLYSGFWEPNEESDDGEPDTPAGLNENKEGVKYLHDWIVRGKDEGIEEAFLKASEKGYIPALNNLGVIYLNGWGVDENIEKAKKHFTDAENYIPALNNLGVIELREALEDPGVLDTLDLSESKAVERIQKAADANYPPAANNLGILHLMKQNYGEATKWFSNAAKFDYAPALFNLGTSYGRGYGGKPDYQKVAELYEKAARKGNVDAQYNLGVMYYQGIGVEKDLVNSFIWLGVAKEQGSAEAGKVQSTVEVLLGKERVSEAILCVTKISPNIHAVDPFTLYDDVAAAPEFYKFPDSWEPPNWVSTYYKREQE